MKKGGEGKVTPRQTGKWCDPETGLDYSGLFWNAHGSWILLGNQHTGASKIKPASASLTTRIEGVGHRPGSLVFLRDTRRDKIEGKKLKS